MIKIEFETSEADYLQFLKVYFFKRIFFMRSAFIVILGAWIAFYYSPKPIVVPYLLLKSIALMSFLFFLSVVIPYLLALRKFKEAFEVNPVPALKTVSLEEEGIRVTTEKEEVLVKWSSVKTAAQSGSYLFIHLISGKYYIFPIQAFADRKQALHFLKVLEESSQKDKPEVRKRKITNLHYIGLLGFIPNVGIIIGILLLVRGFQYKKTTLLVIGLADILFTPFFWLILFQSFIMPTGFKDLAQMQLNKVVKDVEFYNLQNGHYPDRLEELNEDGGSAMIQDPSQGMFSGTTNFNYEKVGDHYLLFSFGPDGVPNTADDLYPEFTVKDSSKIGWVKHK